MMKKYLLLLAPLLFTSRVQAGTSEAGAIFLIIYPGARPNGMGATFTAISDDAVATYYNDAGLGFLDKHDISLMHANWLSGLYPDMYYEFLSYVHPLAGGGVVGGHIIYLTTGETIGMTGEGVEVGRWTTFDASVKVSYATKLNKKMAVGVGAKFIYSFLAPADIIWIVLQEPGGGSGTSWAFDGSALYIPNKNLQLGLSLQNIGPNISYMETGKSDPLPWTLRFGVAWHPFYTEANKLTISLELTKIVVGLLSDLRDAQKDPKKGWTYLYQDTWKGIGAEYTFGDLLAVRAGYFWDLVGRRIGPTFGGGIKFKSLRFDIGVDSAIYDFPTDNYRFSVGYSF